MATFTFSMNSTPLTGSKVFTGSDSDMQDLLDWAKIAYNAIIQQLYNPTDSPSFTPTNAQIGVALATATVSAWKDAVRKFKKDADISAVPEPVSMTWT